MHHFKKNSRGSMPPYPPPLTIAWRGMQLVITQKSWVPLANPAYAHGSFMQLLICIWRECSLCPLNRKAFVDIDDCGTCMICH